ncbi:MAG: L,D-transpeptidase [Myxococcales bacterium]|nr:L,D-transpeptidase [Myxococcales bacterium]
MTVAALLGVAPASAAPEAGTQLAAADLGWPEDTAAATARTRAPVLDSAGRGKRIATVARGTRVTWRRIVASRDGCKAWLELEPRGWACAKDLAPTTDDATTAATGTSAATAPRWADIRKDGADAFASIDDIKSGVVARRVDDKTYVVVKGKTKPVKLDGVTYVKTDQGWIASRSLSWYSPSTYAGIDVTPQTSFSIGWAVAKKPGAKIAVRSAPDPGAPKVRELAPRDLVTIAELSDDMARIGPGEWVEAIELRKPARVARPDGIGAAERWIDIDLDQQILVAYEGDVAVFVTVISSGRVFWETPTGIYRITGKEVKSRMQYQGNPDAAPDDERGREAWNVADVPFSMRFRKNFALHGTYWHEGFGRPRSHGCVNLSTTDAKRLFDWVSPTAPAGWSNLEATGDGTPVRIHSRRDPDPIWRGYDGKPIDAQK